MKRIIAVLIIMVFALCNVSYAQTSPLIHADFEQLEDNKYKAKFSVSDNPGISSFKFSIVCANEAVPVEVIKGDGLKEGIFQTNINQLGVIEEGKLLTVLWINSKNYTDTDELFSVIFESNNSQIPVMYLSYENGDIINEDFMDIKINIDEKLTQKSDEDSEDKPSEDQGTQSTPSQNGNDGGGNHGQSSSTNKGHISISGQNNIQSSIVQPDVSDQQSMFGFTDVKIDDWFYEAVKFVFEKKITLGVSKTEFAPASYVTRGQFITMLCRAYNINEASGDNFADAGNTWYTGYLAAAKQLGISNGTGNNLFEPDREITREEMVTLIYNYLTFSGEVVQNDYLLEFNDTDLISDWANTAVTYAYSKGYVKGKSGNLFDPKGNATRAELAQIFFNVLNID